MMFIMRRIEPWSETWVENGETYPNSFLVSVASRPFNSSIVRDRAPGVTTACARWACRRRVVTAPRAVADLESQDIVKTEDDVLGLDGGTVLRLD